MSMRDRYLFKAKTAQIVGIYNNGLEDGVWVHGSLRCDVGKYTIFQFETERADYVEYEIDPSTICQCTGLKDKNGKLIWENDICDRKEEYPEIVKYNNGDWTLDYSYSKGKESGYCCCNLGFYALERKCVEVIGNIFDNPELLESEG